MADIFISYASIDRNWAFWIGHELETLGHVVHIPDWELAAGGDILTWMEQRHRAADHILCVVSKEYWQNPYSNWERRAAQWAATSKQPGYALPVFVDDCKVPTLFLHLKRCDLYGLGEEDARERLRAFLSPAARPTQRPTFPGSTNCISSENTPPMGAAFPGKAPVSNISIGVPLHFMGREDAFAAIEKSLRLAEGCVAITSLHGLRGVGKTTVAAAYAERHRGDYRVTWWIRAQAESSIRADLVALGIRLGWVGADDKEETALTTVTERMRHEAAGILLIFDNAINADALKPYLPRGGAARVLVTSNSHAWRGVAEIVEIRLWPKEVGGDYLIARTGREGERAAAEALSEALGGLPLAHEQAAAYCERLGISLTDYRKRFEATPARLLDDQRYAPAEHNDGMTVARSFALAIEEATMLHSAAESLIVHAALLAPEPIPLFLFAEGREQLGEPLASMFAGDGLKHAVAALRTFALVDTEAIVDERDASITTGAIRLHRLVREVAASQHGSEEQAQMRGALAAALALVYPADSYGNPASWPRCALLTPHLLDLLANCETELADAPANAERAELLDRAGGYFHGRAAFSVARPIYQRALAIREKALGPEHPDTATSLDSLARLLYAQGDLAGARSLFERALAIREKALGPEHPDTATSLDTLAFLLQAQGDLTAARPICERALAIRETALGPEHPNTATSLNSLALLLQAQGDLAGARPLFERALAILEKTVGPKHSNMATILDSLAHLLQAQGDVAGARLLCERALAIYEKTLGPEHPYTATSLNSLASLFRDQGYLADARPLCERALAIFEKALGPEHPYTGESLNTLASLLEAQGDIAGALPLFERALTIYEKTFGPEHPSTVISLNNLANLLRDQGNLAEAWLLFERAVAVSDKAHGPNHPDTEASLQNLARLLKVKGNHVGTGPARLSAIEWLTKSRCDDFTRGVLCKIILDDPDNDIRCFIVRRLVELWPDESTREFLLGIAKNDKSAEVRTLSCEYLSQLWWKHVGVRQWLRSQSMDDSDENFQQRLLLAAKSAGNQLSSFWENKLSGERSTEEEPEMLPGYPAFKISQFRLRDIGPIRDTGVVDLDRGVNIFLGDNAAGKTTILRSLGLAAIGLAAANEVEDNAVSYLRRGASQGSIEVLFELIPDPDALPVESGHFAVGLQISSDSTRFASIPNAEMTLRRSGPSFEPLPNSTEFLGTLRSNSSSQFGFVSGYGAVRTFGESRFSIQPELKKRENEWVLSLFESDAPLVNPEVFAKLIRGDTSNIEEAPVRGLSADLINELQTSLSHLFPEVQRFFNEGEDDLELNGTRLRFSELSEGYRSLFATMGHMLRCSLKIRNWKDDPTEIDGVALIDEVDLHLHPAWQKHVVQDFRAAFKNIQLIASTHSPLVVGALDTSSVMMLKVESDGTKVVSLSSLLTETPTMKLWRADQILTGPGFDLPTSVSAEGETWEKEFEALWNIPEGKRSLEQERRLLELRHRLKREIPKSAESPQTREAMFLFEEWTTARLKGRSPEEIAAITREVKEFLR